MSKSYQQIALQLYTKYPELGSDIWKKIIQELKLEEKNIYKKINKRSYYNYKLNIIFTFWADSHLKSRERFFRFIKFKNYSNYGYSNDDNI
jgi:hypothetical protein